MTLWFGGEKLEGGDKLIPVGRGSRYSFAKKVGGGYKYRMSSGDIVKFGEAYQNTQAGKYGYVALGDNKWRGRY